jgi:hypothetical protein
MKFNNAFSTVLALAATGAFGLPSGLQEKRYAYLYNLQSEHEKLIAKQTTRRRYRTE